MLERKTDYPKAGPALLLLALSRCDHLCVIHTRLQTIAILTNQKIHWYNKKVVRSLSVIYGVVRGQRAEGNHGGGGQLSVKQTIGQNKSMLRYRGSLLEDCRGSSMKTTQIKPETCGYPVVPDKSTGHGNVRASFWNLTA